jgi:hypothetical protein
VSGAAGASELVSASAPADSLLTIDTAQKTVICHTEFHVLDVAGESFLPRVYAHAFNSVVFDG